jgi:hypothetical protein
LARLQALPSDARPITSWESLDSAFVNVCEGIVDSALTWRGQVAHDNLIRERRVSSRKRIIDVAMPAQVMVERSAMLLNLA